MMDFSKYYQWDESESEEYNLKTKQLWTNNAQESFDSGMKAYHTGKNINQDPLAGTIFDPSTPIDHSIEQQGDTLLQHSTDPTNSMAKINCRFKHNIKWWKIGWKTAYLDHVHKNKNIMDVEKIHKILDEWSSLMLSGEKSSIENAIKYRDVLSEEPTINNQCIFDHEIRKKQIIIQNMLCKEMTEWKNIIFSEPEMISECSLIYEDLIELYFKHLRWIVEKLRKIIRQYDPGSRL